MTLPKIDKPTYDLTVPSTGQTIRIRPFTVKEEKIILLALAGNDEAEVENATRQIINNCVVRPEIDVDKLALYDVEYIFLQLRARSVGEDLKLKFDGIKGSECKKCSKTREVVVDLLAINVVKNEAHSNKIQLSDTIGIVLRDPPFSVIKEINALRATEDFDAVLKLIAKCIEEIYTDDKRYNKKDYKQEEFIEFIESLSQKEFNQIDAFFDTLPRLKHTVNIDCSECGSHQEFAMEGLKDFLA